MKDKRYSGWRKGAAVVMLALASVAGLLAMTPRSISVPACRFVHYYQTLEKADRSVNFWQRVVFSLLLANAPKPREAAGCQAQTS